MLLLVSCKKETDHSDECAIRLINSLLVVHRIHRRKWGQEWKRLFICPVVRVMNVMWGRGLLELLPLRVSDLKLKYDADIRFFFPPFGSSLYSHVCVFIQKIKKKESHKHLKDKQLKRVLDCNTHFRCIFLPTSLKLFRFLPPWFFCLFASRWCCSVFTMLWQWNDIMLSWSQQTCATHYLHYKKKCSLVPELGQIFKINGNFLSAGKKEGKPLSFFIWWAWGVLPFVSLVLLLLFPHTE